MSGLTIDRTGAVIEVTIDRGDDNLLTGEDCEKLSNVLRSPAGEAHVLRLRAAGPNFCLGRERAAETPEDLREEVSRLIDLNTAFGESPLVTLAEVHGDAAGFGVGLAALADVAIAAPTSRLWFPEIRIDLAPVVVLAWLPRVVGRKRAFDLTATGRVLDAREAQGLGILTAVSASEDSLAEEVDKYLEMLLGFSPRAHREIQAYLRATDGLSEAQAYDLALDKLVLGSMMRGA